MKIFGKLLFKVLVVFLASFIAIPSVWGATKQEVLWEKGVPGKGIIAAPGLEKIVPNEHFAGVGDMATSTEKIYEFKVQKYGDVEGIEPNFSTSSRIEIINTGNMDLKYRISFLPDSNQPTVCQQIETKYTLNGQETYFSGVDSYQTSKLFLPVNTTSTLEISGKLLTDPNKIITTSGDGGLWFDGVNDFLQVPHSESLNFSTTSGFTISTWVKLDSLPVFNDGYGFSLSQKSTNDFMTGWWFGLNYVGGGNFNYFGAYEDFYDMNNLGVSLESNQEVPTGQWHHLAVTVDTTSTNLYLDGQWLVSGEGLGDYIINSTDDLLIGTWVDKFNFFHGQMDEMRIYGQALTDGQIKNNYQGLPADAGLDLRAAWSMNEGTGSVAYDSSGNNNHALLGNGEVSAMPAWTSGLTSHDISRFWQTECQGVLRVELVDYPKNLVQEKTWWQDDFKFKLGDWGIVINEIKTPLVTDNISDDYWVELYNQSAYPVDLTDWYLANGKTNQSIFNLDIVLPGNGYTVINLTKEFLPNTGNTLYLFNSDNNLQDIASYNVTRYQDSWSRDSMGNWQYQTPTPGERN